MGPAHGGHSQRCWMERPAAGGTPSCILPPGARRPALLHPDTSGGILDFFFFFKLVETTQCLLPQRLLKSASRSDCSELWGKQGLQSQSPRPPNPGSQREGWDLEDNQARSRVCFRKGRPCRHMQEIEKPDCQSPPPLSDPFNCPPASVMHRLP